MVTVSGNPNPTNPTTKYRCEFGTLFCIYAQLAIHNHNDETLVMLEAFTSRLASDK